MCFKDAPKISFEDEKEISFFSLSSNTALQSLFALLPSSTARSTLCTPYEDGTCPGGRVSGPHGLLAPPQLLLGTRQPLMGGRQHAQLVPDRSVRLRVWGALSSRSCATLSHAAPSLSSRSRTQTVQSDRVGQERYDQFASPRPWCSSHSALGRLQLLNLVARDRTAG